MIMYNKLSHPVVYSYMLEVFLIGFVFPGIEARGFIFGPPIALAIGAKFVPLRKPRKLPGNFNLIPR